MFLEKKFKSSLLWFRSTSPHEWVSEVLWKSRGSCRGRTPRFKIWQVALISWSRSIRGILVWSSNFRNSLRNSMRAKGIPRLLIIRKTKKSQRLTSLWYSRSSKSTRWNNYSTKCSSTKLKAVPEKNSLASWLRCSKSTTKCTPKSAKWAKILTN